MHFRHVNVMEKREASRQLDMSDFSKSATMPQPSQPQTIGDIIEAIDGVTTVATRLFQPTVEDLLRAVRMFIVELQANCVEFDRTLLSELSAWLDERLEVFRCNVAQGDLVASNEVSKHFSAGHDSYAQMMFIAQSQRVREL